MESVRDEVVSLPPWQVGQGQEGGTDPAVSTITLEQNVLNKV